MAKLWPNGEVSIYRPKKFNPSPLVKPVEVVADDLTQCAIRAYGVAGALEALASLGLLNVTNFDKTKNERPRYGLKGITRKGQRVVRNACYLLDKEAGRRFLTFATVTLPSLSDDEMALIHNGWHKIIDAYRREVSRELVRGDVTGEIIGVSEVQPKRFKNTGKPVLHCHFVWVGRKRGKDWIIKPEKHDEIWLRAIATVLPGAIECVKSAAQLKRVKGRVESYLSKYMSKGPEAIAEVVADGFDWWLPKQWWSCSRSLKQRIDREVRIFSEGLPWLIDRAECGAPDFWAYFVPIEIITGDDVAITVAYAGKLTHSVNTLIRQVLNLKPPENFTYA